MKPRWQRWIPAGIAVLAVACGGSSEDPAPAALRAPETFVWAEQPVSFALPPDGWRREKLQQGGLNGVEFVKERSVGERIRVAESYGLGERDRCAELLEMREQLADYRGRQFQAAMRETRPWVPDPLSDRETRLMNAADGSLDRVVDAVRMGDLVIARQEIDAALDHLSRIRYPLDLVVGDVMFTGKKAKNQPGIYEVGDPFTGELAGQPTIGIDYTLQYSGRMYHGREIYVVKNNRLFVASYQGLEENLPLFDRLVQTIEFPTGPCEH